jgi:hypothetical protein
MWVAKLNRSGIALVILFVNELFCAKVMVQLWVTHGLIADECRLSAIMVT